MNTSSAVPSDHPLMLAWEAYKLTEDFANSRRWAAHAEHVDGSLWAAFVEGWNRRAPAQPEPAAPTPDTFMGEPVLTRWKPLNRDESRLALHQSMYNRSFGNPSDDKLMLEWLWENGYALCKREPDEAAPTVVEPVAWAGYDLDGMVEAFHRVIEAHANKNNPFHNPIDADAQMALRILRGFVPAMKAYAATPPRAALTDGDIDSATANRRDALLDHIEEYGTTSEGVRPLVRQLARAVIAADRGEK